MAENNMQIVLDMLDKASPKFKEVNAKLIEEIKKLDKESKKTNDNITKGLRESTEGLRQFRSAIIPIVGIIGSVVLLTKEWSKSNQETRDAFTSLSNSTRILSASVGSLLAPSIIGLSQAVEKSTEFLVKLFDKVREGYENLFYNISFGIQYINAFTTSVLTSVSVAEAHAIAMNTAARSAGEMTDAFVVGMEGVILKNEMVQQSYDNLQREIARLSNEEVNVARAKMEEQVALLKHYEQTFKTAHQGMAALTVTVSKAIQTNMTTALTGIITGTMKAKEAFTQLGQAMVQAIVKFIAETIIASIVQNTILAGSVASSKVAAKVIEKAWEKPALLVSLATGGANAIGAAAGIVSTFGLIKGIGLASDVGQATATTKGVVSGTFGGFQAEGGDYIVDKPTAFIAGEAGPERATFTPLGGGGGGGGTINIIIQGGINPDGLSISAMAEKLGFEFERQVRTARGA